ncbi:unnamed protein product, partial [Meganyctiphanes norvegica]
SSIKFKRYAMSRCMGRQCRLLCMLSLTFIIFLFELVMGHLTKSMDLVADSFHMLSNVLALTVAFMSVKISGNSWSKSTYGWVRAEVMGALINSVFLLALCFSIFVDALQRLYKVEEIENPLLLLIVGCIGVAVNLLGLLLFHDHSYGHGPKRKKYSENTQHIQVDHNHWDQNYNTGQINHSYDSAINERKNFTNIQVCGKNNHNFQNNNHNNETSETVEQKNRANSNESDQQTQNFQSNNTNNDTTEIVEEINRTNSHGSIQQKHNFQYNNHNNDTNENDATKYDKNIQHKCNPQSQIIIKNNNMDKYISHQISTDNELQNNSNSSSSSSSSSSISSSSSSGKKYNIDSQMNIRGVFLHLSSNLCGSIIVIISALVVWFTKWEYYVYIDPVLSLCLVLLISISTLPLLKETSFILLQGFPTNIEIDNVSKQILNVEGVLDVHEFHVWQLTGQTIVASAHI